MSDKLPARARSKGKVPAKIAGEAATTRDGRDITRPFTFELEEYRDQHLRGAVDWGVYDRILLDDQVKSCLEQRRSAVVSREWSVLPGDDDDPRAKEAADALEENLSRLGWDQITDKMLYAPFHGIAVAELLWEPKDGLVQWSQVRVRHARRFRYDKDGRLRLITPRNMLGEIMPERKFWVVTAGASDDDQPYGRGLAEWLYWPCLFKRNGIRFWNTFLDKFAVPPMKGTYPRGSNKGDIDTLLESMMALANDSGVALPEGMMVELLNIANGGIDFVDMPTYMDAATAKIILSQTMTTNAQAGGLGGAQSDVQAGVKQELVIADSDLLTDSFTRGPSRWWTDFNFGTDVAAPIVSRQVEEEDDTKTSAETDAALDRLGWTRTEDSFRSVYGDGYEKKPVVNSSPAGPAGEGGQAQPGGASPEEGDNVVPIKRAASEVAEFAEPRTLYVCRKLRNAKDLIRWAKAQGFKSTVPVGEMHVTVTYSRHPVDWFAMGQSWSGPDGTLTVPAGGPRQVGQLGEGEAIVLFFASSELSWRNKEMRDAGASWDYPEYSPHVTITYDGAGVDLASIEPFQGELVFGPEIFQAIDDGWGTEVQEVSFAEPPPATDLVDDATARIMADEGWLEGKPIAGALFDELARAASAEEVKAILARSAELDDEAALTEALARAGFAVKMAGFTGTDGATL